MKLYYKSSELLLKSLENPLKSIVKSHWNHLKSYHKATVFWSNDKTCRTASLLSYIILGSFERIGWCITYREIPVSISSWDGVGGEGLPWLRLSQVAVSEARRYLKVLHKGQTAKTLCLFGSVTSFGFAKCKKLFCTHHQRNLDRFLMSAREPCLFLAKLWPVSQRQVQWRKDNMARCCSSQAQWQ